MRGPFLKREHKAFSPPRRVARIQPRPIARSAKAGWRNPLLLGLLLFAGGAVATAFWFQADIWPLSILNQPQTIAPDSQTDRRASQTDRPEQKEGNRTPRLALQNSTAAVNQPLPLAISLTHSTGGETLVLNGLVEGTSLSAGTALSTTRWSLPGQDLDKTFVSAPNDFNGIMQVAVTLYSSAQDVLETKEVRFEWSNSRKGDKLPVTNSPAARFSR